jgi:lysophospholipase L1-like esterase
MKKYSIISLMLSTALIIGCEQEIAELTPPEQTETPTGSLGANISLTKFVTIGNSLVAGYQSNALFNEGQSESLGKILNQQFTYAGGTSEFNQPDINSENGFSGTIPGTTIPVGRLVLFDPDGSGPRSAGPAASGTPAREVTCPSVVSTPAVPAPYNTADLPTPFTGDKTKLNNFGVPGIQLGQVLIPDTGNPASPAYNPLWARFASQPGVKSILQDAIAANPSFFLIEVGNNDILGYATSGGSNPAIFTSVSDFNIRYNTMITSMLTALPNVKGVVANIPNVTSIPFFFTVSWNSVPLDATTAATVTTNLATPYNGFLQQLAGLGLISAEEATKRTLSYSAASNNAILITDETLTDLTPYMTGQAAGLLPYAKARQTKSTDLITLSAGAVLGTCVGGSATAINGVTIPLGDSFVLLPSETQEILTRTEQFNQIIATAVTNSNNRLALADVNTAFSNFVASKGTVVNGILLTPSITPPYAGFSEDGVHPNGRGYAFLANIFIDAINTKFGSTIPKADITKYRGTRTPVSPTKSF